MTLDEATTAFLAQMTETGIQPIHRMTPGQARDLGGLLRQMYGGGPDMKRVFDEEVRLIGDSIPVRVMVPAEHVSGVIVYFHGGGWMMGTIDEFDTIGRELASRTGCAVALVGYRLAPEHPYPTAVDDSWASLLWADAHLEQIAGSRVPLIVAGDSAGGNLAAIVTQRAREQGGPDIAVQVLVYPVTDSDLDTNSYLDPSNQLMISRDSMLWFWENYAPDVASRSNPTASPMRAPDLSRLPPAVVLTAEHDPLRDEGEAYAALLSEAGVPVELERFAGQMHGFFQMINVLPGSSAGLDYIATALTRHLNSSEQ